MSSSESEDEYQPRRILPITECNQEQLETRLMEYAEGENDEYWLFQDHDDWAGSGLVLMSVILGFHKGSLDMCGRHMERYRFSKEVWTKMLLDCVTLIRQSTPQGGHGRGEGVRGGGRGAKKQVASEKLSVSPVDEEQWHTFAFRWAVYPLKPAQFVAYLECVTNVLQMKPLPVFQELLLENLPVELIREIYSYLSINGAKKLSLTSKYFRKVGEPYIFVDRTFTLEHPWEGDPGLSVELPIRTLERNVKKFATEARSAYLKKIKLLESRPVVVSSIQTLRLRNEWEGQSMFTATRYEHLEPSVKNPSFYNGIYKKTCRLLKSTINLTTLKLQGFKITKSMIQSLATLRSLYTVQFYSCSLPPSLRKSAGSMKELDGAMLCLSVLNINFGFRNNDDEAPWLVLRFFPNLHNLTIGPFPSKIDYLLDPQEGIFFPEITTLVLSPVFSTLKRFCINRIESSEIRTLTLWMVSGFGAGRQASDLGSLTSPNYGLPTSSNLTHFKFHSVDWIPSDQLTSLLTILKLATHLEVCDLRGIGWSCAFSGIIPFVAEILPGLKHLTLAMFAQQERPDADLVPPLPSRSVEWPEPTCIYAPHFSRFQRLESFSWNNRYDPSYLPKEMKYVEEGYPAWLKNVFPDTPWTDGEDEEEDEEEYNDRTWDEDMNPDASMFAAYCPTLRTYTILADKKRPARQYNISRTNSGMRISGGRVEDLYDEDSDEDLQAECDAELDKYAGAIWNVEPSPPVEVD
ncbi:hypothetical protein FRB91_004175 [Serendipita sp. 411]|nr:hypothetical protein FRC15_004496 [Serendipita sp. 397]KAG8777236.1 hypothetical protein FRC16_004243 [Serendipita sp. 398]KAG8828739.1 hypothetical protein FRC19_000127 [Serendipita sp. 401]KAG8842454.1 hypothetical protein FRB91_004175 [Serendipita sp. 411]KAG8842460.1 hypothetical protein FRC20_004382 [Serendipita sp. 405]KAG9058810.1 hypothetical protein FS842_000007 [Serendipita sp. 407]